MLSSKSWLPTGTRLRTLPNLLVSSQTFNVQSICMASRLPYPANTPVNSSGFLPLSPGTVQANSHEESIESPPPPPPPPPKSDSIPIKPTPGRSNQPLGLIDGQTGLRNHENYSETQQIDLRLGSGSQAPSYQARPIVVDHWMPGIMKDKSKSDLEAIVSDSDLMSSLLYASTTTHPSLSSSEGSLREHLNKNVTIASQTLSIESQIHSLRSSLTPSLLRVAALERQFRAKQEAMDDALAPWAPKAVHSRLIQGVQEQEAWCRAMEESFLDGPQDGGTDGVASDREISEWLRKYRDGRKVLELRREKKLRLEEGRVGGWK